ncbi:MAG: PQQ-dependent sugar dehydrogenase, partial [Candidatus Kapaibacterium sp.]
MKKIIFIIALLATSLLYSQHKVQIIGIDDSVNEYAPEDISKISFDLDGRTIAIVSTSDNQVVEIELNSQSQITFNSGKMMFAGENGSNEFALDLISTIEFEEVTTENRYPFGELVVDEIVVDNLNNPWSIAFIDKDNILFTEKDGGLYRHNMPEDRTYLISGVPDFASAGQGGMLDVTLHPNFEENKMVYLVYSVGVNFEYTTAVGRGVMNGN